MVSIIAASEDHLLPHLDYKLEKTASYIESRQEVTSFSSVPIASPNGVKVLPFQITSDQFIDPNSVFFIFNVNNLDASTPTKKALLPLGERGVPAQEPRQHAHVLGDARQIVGVRRLFRRWSAGANEEHPDVPSLKF